MNNEENNKKEEKKEWTTPALIILDVETSTLGSAGIGATDGPLYS